MLRMLISSAMPTSWRESCHDGPAFAPLAHAMRIAGRRRGLGAILMLAGLLFGAPGPGEAQEPQPPEFSDQMSVGFVLVPVVVRAGAGFAKNLEQKDFRLLVDGKPVPIESFERRSDAPASLVILQDLSGSMA